MKKITEIHLNIMKFMVKNNFYKKKRHKKIQKVGHGVAVYLVVGASPN
jgi:hypothetical protein